MAKIYMNINARLFYECLSDKTTRCLPFPELQPRTKLLRQFHLFSTFCALLPSPLIRKRTPPPHPRFNIVLV